MTLTFTLEDAAIIMANEHRTAMVLDSYREADQWAHDFGAYFEFHAVAAAVQGDIDGTGACFFSPCMN